MDWVQATKKVKQMEGKGIGGAVEGAQGKILELCLGEMSPAQKSPKSRPKVALAHGRLFSEMGGSRPFLFILFVFMFLCLLYVFRID